MALPHRVIVYCSVDESISRPILDRYREQSGTELSITFDSEAGKTTGLVNRIVTEARSGRVRADVFWSGELFHTITLARQNLLLPYDPPSASDIPTRYRDPGRTWTAYAVRGRVLAYDPRVTNAADLPTDWEQLGQPQFASQTAIANPLFGTTHGHVAAMFNLWGPLRGQMFLTNLRDGGALVTDGNSAAVRAVIQGKARYAATDTDDVWAAQRAGESVEFRILDMGNGGTLAIPCSVAILRAGPNPEGARALVDHLISPTVERLLAESVARHIPVREALRDEMGIESMVEGPFDFTLVADQLPVATEVVRNVLLR